jgi:hypothetical protein
LDPSTLNYAIRVVGPNLFENGKYHIYGTKRPADTKLQVLALCGESDGNRLTINMRYNRDQLLLAKFAPLKFRYYTPFAGALSDFTFDIHMSESYQLSSDSTFNTDKDTM